MTFLSKNITMTKPLSLKMDFTTWTKSLFLLVAHKILFFVWLLSSAMCFCSPIFFIRFFIHIILVIFCISQASNSGVVVVQHFYPLFPYWCMFWSMPHVALIMLPSFEPTYFSVFISLFSGNLIYTFYPSFLYYEPNLRQWSSWLNHAFYNISSCSFKLLDYLICC